MKFRDFASVLGVSRKLIHTYIVGIAHSRNSIHAKIYPRKVFNCDNKYKILSFYVTMLFLGFQEILDREDG